jgi:hypothetical protein
MDQSPFQFLLQTAACTNEYLGWLAARGSPGQHSMELCPESSDVLEGHVLWVYPGWEPRRCYASRAQKVARCGSILDLLMNIPADGGAQHFHLAISQ